MAGVDYKKLTKKVEQTIRKIKKEHIKQNKRSNVGILLSVCEQMDIDYKHIAKVMENEIYLSL